MKRTTIFLREAVEGDLRAIARRQQMPVAEIVREAIDEYVARSKQRARARPGFIAAGASGRSDGADRHEELLWTTLEPHGAVASKEAGPSRVPRPSSARRKRSR